MKKASKLLLAILLSAAIFSFDYKTPVRSDPTTSPYVWAIPWYYSQIDIWVRWTPDVSLSRDYYADILVSYNDDCGIGHTKTVRVIIPKGTWTAWENFDTCFHMTVTGYSITSWGPL